MKNMPTGTWQGKPSLPIVDWTEVLEQLQDGVYFVDLQRRITYWNRAAERITGYPAAEVIGSCCGDNILMHVDLEGTLLCEVGCPLTAVMGDGQSRSSEVYLHHRNGHRVPVLVRASPLRDESGVIIGGIELFTDISTQYAMAQRMRELETMAMVDTLTNLANRGHLEMELDARLQGFDRYRLPFGLLFMDVDHFKNFNDRFGHDMGDRALKTVAATLRATARPFDIFGRWGGEEFIGIIRNIDPLALRKMADRLRRLIEGSSIGVPGSRERITVSIGATLVRPGDTPTSIVRRADQLMYQSKQAGRNCVTSDL
jgi:diguanylate cyclase (GGDEF)-like protein/PAS domain S-box-containing protein